MPGKKVRMDTNRRAGAKVPPAQPAATQVDLDNARVPRDWANDPVWLRDLLRRLCDELPDDLPDGLAGPIDSGEQAQEEYAERIDLLMNQIRFVLGEP